MYNSQKKHKPKAHTMVNRWKFLCNHNQQETSKKCQKRQINHSTKPNKHNICRKLNYSEMKMWQIYINNSKNTVSTAFIQTLDSACKQQQQFHFTVLNPLTHWQMARLSWPHIQVAVWFMLAFINVVALHRVRLVLGWVTIWRWVNHHSGNCLLTFSI